MAGSEGSKYRDIFLLYKINLTDKNQDPVLPDELFIILQLIDKQGTIVAAAAAHNISFRKAWNMLKKAEKRLGFQLIIPTRGGQHGGSSELSTEGKQLLNAYTELVTAFDQAIHDVTKKFFRTINTK